MVSTRSGFRGPEADSRPSKHVFLLVTAADRKAPASANLFEEEEDEVVVSLESDFFNEERVIWWSSLQSWMVPFCFSMILPSVFDKKGNSLTPSLMANWRDWRTTLTLMFMEIDSFKESKQTSGYGVDLQTDLIREAESGEDRDRV